IEFDDGGLERGAVIGTDEYRDDESEVFGDIAIGRGVTLDIKCKNQNNDYSSMRAGIGSGFSNGCGNIYIGTGANITIDILGKGNTTVTDGAGIGGGMCYDEDWAKKCGDIIIYSGATVNVKANCGAAIGGSAAWGYCSDITIYSDAKVEASSKYGAGIGAGIQYSHNYNRVGNITVYSYSSGDVNVSTSDEAKALSAEDIGKGYPYSPDGSTEIGDINLLDEYKKVEGGTLDWGSLENEGGFEVTTTTTTTREVAKTITETRNSVVETFDEKEDRITTTVYEDIAEKKTPHNPLVIHHGSKANIEIDIYFKDMRSSAMGLDGVKIVPKENAALALDKVDDAIEYALDEATNIGAYCNRLEFTKNNLETSNENTVAAESVIRDADMAREATEFAKYNVLAEASNAMLAQANQEFSRILSLLQ
ncbi:MAG: hypothetical protein J6I62_10910, partial [Selenomonadaceae bacterium]|nr:hypothetical protein [Selenomonadaceae bacterium]